MVQLPHLGQKPCANEGDGDGDDAHEGIADLTAQTFDA
jgi:hypothetical protein